MSAPLIRRVLAAAATITALGAIASSPALAVTGAIKEFTISTPGAGPYGITGGPDGNVWFTEHGFGGGMPAKPIGKITPNGDIMEYAADAGSLPDSITTGPDGNLWFTDPPNDDLGKMTPAGVYTKEADGKGLIGTRGIATGPDHNLYVVVTGTAPAEIAEVSTAGAVLGESKILGFGTAMTPLASNPQQIIAGPDGNMWFTETATSAVGRVNLNDGQNPHTITEFHVGTNTDPRGLAVGPDGKIWFTQTGPAPPERIGHINVDGTGYDQTDLMTAGTGDPEGMALGQDGGLWFDSFLGDQIGRASATSKALTQFGAGITAGAGVRFIARGADGNMWFTEEMGDRIGRVIVDPPVTTPPPTTTGSTPPPPPADRTPPVITKLAISSHRIKAGTKATISFSLSEAAAVELTIQRASTGRSVGGRCVRATHANRRHHRCTRYTSSGKVLRAAGVKGTNRISLSVPSTSSLLRAGSYRIEARAVDAALNHSKTIDSSSFAVVAKPKKHHHAKHHR